MLAGQPDLDAIVMCQPPQVRFDAAWQALTAGKHVFLEKPPGVTVSEVDALIALAADRHLTCSPAGTPDSPPAVAPARAWLEGRRLRRVSIVWEEDVRHWHPGQGWIWEPGGFGVFDPGINALSILTEIVREPIRLVAAKLEVPSNREAPIAASLSMRTAAGRRSKPTFDWRQTGPQRWDVEVQADGGTLALTEGGNRLAIDGVPQPAGEEGEYPAMYRHFAELVGSGPERRRCAAAAAGRRCLPVRPSTSSVEPFED